MPGLDCKQILCLSKLSASIRAIDRISRKEDISDKDMEAIINCAENAISDFDKILETYTE